MATEKKMNLRRFVQKSANAFSKPIPWLVSNNDYLCTFTGVPAILAAFKSGEISSNEAYSKVMEILSIRLMNEVMESVNKAPSANASSGRSASKEYNYTVEVYFSDSNGNESVRETGKFENFQRADDFAIRNLSEDYCGTRAVISGHGFMTEILRNDAIARFWGGRARKPFMKKMSFGNNLKFIGKAKQTHCSFSRG